MSRMFQRVLATSVIGAAALAAPAAAMAADTGGGSGGGNDAETPTSVVLHLPKHVEAGEPVTVTARIIPQPAAAQTPGGEQPGKSKDGKGKDGKGKHKGKNGQGDEQQGKDDGKDGKGDEPGKDGKGHHHKGSGHGKKGKGKRHKGTGRGRRHAVTGKVEFLLDGKPEPSVEVSRDQASEKIQIPVGRHTLVAVYSGDGNFEPAKSTPVTFELKDDPDNQGIENGDGQGGHVGPITEAGQVDPTVGGQQADPGETRDSGDLAPGDQDQSDQGPDSDDQDWQDDQD